MSFIRAHAMMSDEAGNVVQLTASREKEMLNLIRDGLRHASEVPDTFLEGVHPRLAPLLTSRAVLRLKLTLLTEEL